MTNPVAIKLLVHPITLPTDEAIGLAGDLGSFVGSIKTLLFESSLGDSVGFNIGLLGILFRMEI